MKLCAVKYLQILICCLGIALSCLDPVSVVLSDLPIVLDLLEANIELNKHKLCRYAEAAETIGSDFSSDREPLNQNGSPFYCVVGYKWGDSSYCSSIAKRVEVGAAHDPSDSSILPLFKECEVAIASDVVYDPIGYYPLYKTISDFLLSGNDKYVVMAHRHRNPEDEK